MTARIYHLAQIIFSEKMNEKFEPSIEDSLIGMDIFASQNKLDEYREKFNELTGEKNQFEFKLETCEEIGRTLMNFNRDEHK